MSRLLDALDAALDAFETAVAPVAPDADGATAASEVVSEAASEAIPQKTAENRHFSTGAAGKAVASDAFADPDGVIVDPSAGAVRSHQFSGVAPMWPPLKPAENRHFSTGATRATPNEDITVYDTQESQNPVVHGKTDRTEGRARRVSSYCVAPVAPVEQRQKTACFTGATQNRCVAPGGTTAVFCGFEAFFASVKHFHGPKDSYGPDPNSVDDSYELDEHSCRSDYFREEAQNFPAAAKARPGPAGDDLAAWQAWMRPRYAYRRRRGYSRAEAWRIVWGDAECEWHQRQGAVPDPDRCAGCGERLAAGEGVALPDGAVVHIGDPEIVECPAVYGAQWRGAASVALMKLGLTRPWL